jgi:hypothetical protein
VVVAARGYEDYIRTLARTAGFADELSLALIEPTDPPLETGHSTELLEAIVREVLA